MPTDEETVGRWLPVGDSYDIRSGAVELTLRETPDGGITIEVRPRPGYKPPVLFADGRANKVDIVNGGLRA